MDEFGSSRLEGLGIAVKRKRSQILRRPRPERQTFLENHDQSPLSSAPDDMNQVSSDENNVDANSRGKIFNLNHCLSRDSLRTRTETEYPYKRTKKDDGGLYSNGGAGNVMDQSRITSSRHLIGTGDNAGNENKLKKVKLKVGGVTRTIQAKSNAHHLSGSEFFAKSNRPSDAPRLRQKLILQDNSDEEHSPSTDKKSSLEGLSWKDFSGGSFGSGKEDMGRTGKFEKQGEKSDPVRKSKRVRKRRVLDGAFGEDDEDDEIRYLEKLKSSKVNSGYRDLDAESEKKQRSLSRVSKGGKHDNVEDFGKSGKNGKKFRSEKGSEDTDYEEELLSDGELEGRKQKKQRKDSSDSPTESKREMSLTSRQRALLSSKDSSPATGSSQIEFPDGLPPPVPRKQKEKLSEVEQQLKKAEAAQRRRMQNEKAARESEAEAIRKILGQDSNRKKREEKMKKRQEELAQEKAANAQMLASNTIRLVMGPTGTIVTFPQDMGFPRIFDSKPCSYPPPREKCAGPSCTNPYKYRDSKSNLPLCSLQCYKAIHEKTPAETAC